MLRRLLFVTLVALFAMSEIAPTFVYAQDTQAQPAPKRKNLFDLLFGGGDEEPAQQPVVKAPVVKPPKKAALPPPPKPTVSKATTAVRLAVFGDSLAVDLAGALTRLYAEDPNIVIINQGVTSSGFARPDFFDWNKTATDQVTKNSFDVAVAILGINDRQSIKTADKTTLKTLTPEWSSAYQSRVAQFVATIRGANKPVIWVGLPPMAKDDLSSAMGQISALQRLGAFASGGDFIDIYDRFVDDNGAYAAAGPDLNGNQVKMRKDDGIRFTNAGADKLAFYVSQTIKLYYRGGAGVGIEVADALAGTDAALMVRPPYQGLGQTRLLEVAGAVIPLSSRPKPALDLVTAAPPGTGDAAFDFTQMFDAPTGRVDAFGVGKAPTEPEDAAAVTPA
ncbi:MAG: DUF459 domain-containing protein, partial [Devosia sp.]